MSKVSLYRKGVRTAVLGDAAVPLDVVVDTGGFTVLRLVFMEAPRLMGRDTAPLFARREVFFGFFPPTLRLWESVAVTADPHRWQLELSCEGAEVMPVVFNAQRDWFW